MSIKKLPSTGDEPRSTGVPESLVPGGAGDSAGFPWDGRVFDHHGTEFADDDGAAPEALVHAIAAVRAAAAAGTLGPLAQATADAIVVLSGCRLLIPLLAEAGDLGVTPEGRTVEKTQELSIVTVAAPDGRRVMPVFSSVDAMRRWKPGARPIPVPAPQAALAAAQEHTDLIVVDPGTPEQEFGVRRTQLEALALGRRQLPAWADAEVQRAFKDTLLGDPRVVSVELMPGDPEARLLAPETDVIVRLAAGLDRAELTEVLSGAQQRWAVNAIIADRVDSLRVRPLAA